MKCIGKKWVKAIERSDDIAEWVPFVSEIACGSRMKYALDKRSGQLAVHRALADGIHYPTNYGFIPRTLTEEDGMETDLLALSSEPLLPLTVAHVRVIGGCTICSNEKNQPEDKLLGVVLGDPDVERLAGIGDVDPKLRKDIESFFTTYKADEGVTVTFQRWFGRDVALDKLTAVFEAARRTK